MQKTTRLALAVLFVGLVAMVPKALAALHAGTPLTDHGWGHPDEESQRVHADGDISASPSLRPLTAESPIPPPNTVSVDPPKAVVYRGQTVDVTVRIDGPGAISAFDFHLSWDDSVLQFVEVALAGGFAETETFTEDVGTDSLFFSASLESGSTDEGELAVITLLAPVGSAAGRSVLHLSRVDVVGADEKPLDVNVEDGSVRSIAMDVFPAYPSEWKGVGTTFKERVRLHGAEGLREFQLQLSWDPTVVTVLGVAPAEDLAEPPIYTATLDLETGTLGIVAEWLAPSAGDLMVITMETLTPGTSDLTLSDALLTEADLPSRLLPEEALGHGELHVAESVVWVSPAESRVMEQDTVTVDILKSSEEALSAFEFQLAFDPARVEFVDVVPGADATGVVSGALEAADVISVTGEASGGSLVPSGTAAMARLTFKVQDAGISALDIIDAVEADDTPYSPVVLTDTESMLLPDPEVLDGSIDATERAVAFEFIEIDGLQVVDVPFQITVRAVHELGHLAHYSGTANLSTETGMVSPTVADFRSGVAILDVTMSRAQKDATITVSATDEVTDNPITGDSNPFDVCGPIQIIELASDSPVGPDATTHLTATVQGTEPITYTWDFGDGGTGDLLSGGEETAAYRFAGAGTYTVSLTVDNACGTDTKTLVVEVSCADAEIIELTSDSPVGPGETMHFTATVEGTEPITYSWDFGDEGAGDLLSGGEETAAYRFAAAGTYTVTLTVDNACGTDTETLVVEVSCADAEIIELTSDSPVTLGEPMHATSTVKGTEPITYTWDFGDEGVGDLLSGGEEMATYVFAATGTYTVTLTVENSCGIDTEALQVMVVHRVYLPLVLSH